MKPSHHTTRGDLRTLERIAVDLELYAARNNLIHNRGPGLIGSADLLDDRSNQAISAIAWLQEEMIFLATTLAKSKPPGS